MFFRVSDCVEEIDPERQLVELEDTYCLPRGFWTTSEWNRYTHSKYLLLKQIKEDLRDSPVYCQELVKEIEER